MSTQVAADLRAAADVLERDGWTQRVYHASDGCHCAEGAIALAIGQHVRAGDIPGDGFTYLDDGWWAAPSAALWDRRFAAERAVQEQVAKNSVIDWNDAEGRTVNEVIATLRVAADHAEGTR